MISKEWTKLEMTLHHTSGQGHVQISWDAGQDAFLVNLVNSASGAAPDSTHMDPNTCINYVVQAIYDAFLKLMPRDKVAKLMQELTEKIICEMAAEPAPHDQN